MKAETEIRKGLSSLNAADMTSSPLMVSPPGHRRVNAMYRGTYLQHPRCGSHVLLAGMLGFQSLAACMRAGYIRCGLVKSHLYVGFHVSAATVRRSLRVLWDYHAVADRYSLEAWQGDTEHMHMINTMTSEEAAEARNWLRGFAQEKGL